MTTDYKSTLFLPRTSFPMKANLPNREPELLARWAETGLWQRLRTESTGREKFVLHDGPPYANGPIHIGTAMNKILKDVINRAQQMLGKDAAYVPGWDCHGLPIEWQIEQDYRKKGRNKDDVPVDQFRRECRAYAEHWIDRQREDFKRLGVMGDWDNPYLTMSYDAEAQIVRELGKFLMSGQLYRGSKPVMWSPVEKTALAEAEVEYHDIDSTTIYVAFPVTAPSVPAVDGAAVVIWTTTPWTIPGNRAIAFGEDVDYGVYEVETVSDEALVRPGDRFVVGTALAADVMARAGARGFRQTASLKGRDLTGTVTAHPLAGDAYRFPVPLHAGEFVDIEQGTGFVHIAPGHGADDWELGRRVGLEVPDTVGDDGVYLDHVPLFAGLHVFKAAEPVIEALKGEGRLLASSVVRHSYPHSWRSKKPVIFRNTPQWFIGMDSHGLRETALDAIDAVRWVPAASRNRIRAMVATRPDWCVSRQRAWGVPITVFVDRESGEPLRDETVLERVAAAVEAEGADIWFTADPARFLAPEHDPARYERVDDILDVWFDSGSTHSFVLEGRDDLAWPASLYLEGSDQHRGWFQSSLLEACGTRGRAPYETVLTHGFVMDGLGRKMSKSIGNVVAPQEVIKASGADILRLWVATADYTGDLRIGPEILNAQIDLYRRLRNTLRYLLGNLDGFRESERLPAAEMPELERWVLHRLATLDGRLRDACDNYDFDGFYTELHGFCSSDLSAFYFDVRKDALYCDGAGDTRRRAARTVLDALFSCLTAWLAPILCFTAEEAWLSRWPDAEDSVHLRRFPDIPGDWRDDVLARKWETVRMVRRVVTGALEIERRDKRIGASLQGHPTVYTTAAVAAVLADIDLAELSITSDLTIVTDPASADAFTSPEARDVAVVVALAEGERCERCWRVLPEVGGHAGHEALCDRCVSVVETLNPAA